VDSAEMIEAMGHLNWLNKKVRGHLHTCLICNCTNHSRNEYVQTKEPTGMQKSKKGGAIPSRFTSVSLCEAVRSYRRKQGHA
jgi:hypothetical protein